MTAHAVLTAGASLSGLCAINLAFLAWLMKRRELGHAAIVFATIFVACAVLLEVGS